MDKKLKNMKKISAFTMAEILITLSIIGVIVTMTLISTFSSDRNKDAKKIFVTRQFYTNISGTYIKLLSENPSASVKGIEDENNDNKVDSKDLAELFNKYLNTDTIDCKEMKPGTNISSLLTNATCIEFGSTVIAGFVLDKNCKTTVNAKEYFDKNNTIVKEIKNACGYIVYGQNGKSAQKIGTDAFVIALGKTDIKL